MSQLGPSKILTYGICQENDGSTSSRKEFYTIMHFLVHIVKKKCQKRCQSNFSYCLPYRYSALVLLCGLLLRCIIVGLCVNRTLDFCLQDPFLSVINIPFLKSEDYPRCAFYSCREKKKDIEKRKTTLNMNPFPLEIPQKYDYDS